MSKLSISSLVHLDAASWWRYGLVFIIAVYIVLAVTSLFTLPVFEGIDEQRHYAYARYLISNRTLPPLHRAYYDNPATYEVGQESGQPPLMYALVALITAPIAGADDVQPYVLENPYMTAYDVTGVRNDNHNRYLRTTQEEGSKSRAVLAVRMGRLVAVALGVLTLCGVFGAARCVVPDRIGVALLATGMVATQPVFIFINGIVSNDAAVVCCCSLSTWVAVRLIRQGLTLKWVMLGGLLSGLAVLSKFNGIWIGGIVWLAIIMAGVRAHLPVRRVIALLAVSATTWLLVVLWWFIYNWSANGNPFNLQVHAYGAQSPLRVEQLALDTLGQRLLDLESTVWYFSGWAGLVPGPYWLYTMLRIIWFAGAVGAIPVAIGVMRRCTSLPLAHGGLLLLCVGLGFAGALYWVLVYLWALGRLMFPGLAAAAVISAIGWSWWIRRIPRFNFDLQLRTGLAVLMALTLLICALGSVMNTATAYVRHADISPTQPQMDETDLTFIDPAASKVKVASVVAYEFTRQDVRSGGALYGKVCWKSQNYTIRSFPYSVQLVGEDDTRPGTRSSYHGLGSYPLAIWIPGEVFCDPVSILITGDVPRPRAYGVLVSLFDFKSGALTAVDAAGQKAHPIITRVRLAPTYMPVVTPTVSVGNLAGLVDWNSELRADNILSITLRWVALAATPVDAKIFVHILNADGTIIAQHDHQPDMGWFPTNFWQKGDVIEDHFTVKLPAGTRLEDVHMGLGMYDAQTLQRLPATSAASSERLRDDIFIVRPDQ